jgi:hypothetical protein
MLAPFWYTTFHWGVRIPHMGVSEIRVLPYSPKYLGHVKSEHMLKKKTGFSQYPLVMTNIAIENGYL